VPYRYQIKYCRHCGRIIPLDSAECPYCERLVIRSHEQKVCPFCGEAIKARAVKCKHCGEFLDGRTARPPDRQQILHIEKAIIAAPGRQGEIELLRPDGRPLKVGELGSAARGELPPAAEPEAGEQRAAADLPVRAPGAPAPARRGMQAIAPGVEPTAIPARAPAKRVETPPEKPAPEPPEAPPVELECPVCKRTVFHGDHYCENCGRDLSLRKGQTTIRPIAYPYDPTDYALLLSAVAPLGLLLPALYSWLLAAGGTVMGGWCAWRIMTSGGKLKGMKGALGAIMLGLFWLVTILLVKGFHG